MLYGEMNNYFNNKLLVIINGTYRQTGVENLNISFLDNNIDNKIVEKVLLDIEKIKKFDDLVNLCGGIGYLYLKEEVEEIEEYKIVSNLFPIMSENNFYYFIYR